MIKNVFRKGLVIGIIILFVGASVLPIVNSMKIQRRLSLDLEPRPVFTDFAVAFNLTFYGEAVLLAPIEIPDLFKIRIYTYSQEFVKSPVARLCHKNMLQKESEGFDIQDSVTLVAWIVFDFETNMTYSEPQDCGYVRGFAMYLSVSYI